MTNPPWEHEIEQWQSTIDHAPDIVLTIDRNGTILFASTVRSNFDAATLVGTEATVFMPEHERESFLRRVDKVFATGEACEYEVTGISPAQTTAHYHSLMSPVMSNGTVIAANILARDLSARAQARQRIVDAFEREQQTTARLRAVDREQRDFTAKVIHDMRTPITIIDGFARTLVDDDLVIPAAQQEEFLMLMSDASRRLVLLTDDILEMYRVEQPDMLYNIAPLDLVKSIQEAVASFGPQSAAVSMPDRADRVWVLADDRRHQQVCINLLSNAFTYAPDSPVAIEISCDQTHAHVSVVDGGPGIAAEHLTRLFGKFFQVPRPASANGGSGLGLYICKALIEAQQGSIQVTSKVGTGTTFTYSLPLISSS